MLAKCANPSCSASFRHLRDGRLFLLETDRSLRSPEANAAEYFWLCTGCSAGMTLCLAQDGRVVATGLRKALRNGPQPALISVNRENGLLLRRVSFLRSRHPGIT
jgi:hypothetical protein